MLPNGLVVEDDMTEISKEKDYQEQQVVAEEVELFDPWDQEFRADIERRNSDFDY